MLKSVTIFAPATIANVGPGFDILGFAMESPGDILEISLSSNKKIHQIINKTNIPLPEDPSLNVSTVAIDSLLKHLKSDQKFKIVFIQKIPPGSGMGSSASSAAGAVFAANYLLTDTLLRKKLIPFAMQGEKAASGSAHADNVAPCLSGGFTLIRSYHPLDIIRINAPHSLYCAVLYPEISIHTESSRKILKEKVPLKNAIEQCGNVAGLITGLLTSNFRLIKDSLHDVIAEPARSFLIPHFKQIKKAALEAGALGSSISGSGPSIFALCKSYNSAIETGNKMKNVLIQNNIPGKVYVSGICKTGVRILNK